MLYHFLFVASLDSVPVVVLDFNGHRCILDVAGLYRADKNIPRAFLGVGAPEAVLVGVVALVLFGPKGLAQAAKSLGQAVKAVAPTLKELTDISSDLKSTIEDEIGLSEIRDELQSTLTPIAKPTAKDAFNDKDDFDDPDIMAKREESAKLAWSGGERYTEEVDQNKNVDSMSVEELEAEILRRKVSDS